jgi:anti-anti-sigma regulatory factor
MDCAGLGALIALRNLARARNGAVRLLNPTPTVQRLFDVVRAEEIFEIVNTPTDTPRWFASHPTFSRSSLPTCFALH